MLQRAPKVKESWFDGYAGSLATLLQKAEATDRHGRPIQLDSVVDWAVERARRAHEIGNKTLFIGNGGSAGTASHLALDFSKNGNLRALALNDASSLTALGNDYGFEHVFAKQIEFYGAHGDFLVAISASGKSANILNAVAAARNIGCDVLTLSGLYAENPLRKTGDMNVFLPSEFYGLVELGHVVLCHALVDYSMEQDGRGRARANR